MPGQVKLADFNLLDAQEGHPSITATKLPAAGPTEEVAVEEAAGVAPAIKIAKLWVKPTGLPRLFLMRLSERDARSHRAQYVYHSSASKVELERERGNRLWKNLPVPAQMLLDSFEVILGRADREWSAMDNPEQKARFGLVEQLIDLISRVFPIPLDNQYEPAAAATRLTGGDPEALKVLVYFLENKVAITNTFGGKSSIVQLDRNLQTLIEEPAGMASKQFTISGSVFTGTLFGTTVSLKPNTLEALVKKLLIAAHDLSQHVNKIADLARPGQR